MNRFSKNKGIIVLIAAVCVLGAAVGILNAGKNETTVLENVAEVVFTPVQKLFTRIGGGVSDFFGYFSSIDDLRDENAELKKEIAELKKELRDGETDARENESLRSLLSLKEAHPEYTFECAEIIARDPSNWFNIITVDKGKADGIAVNQPAVAAGNALIGRVCEVGSTWSKIITITDREHSAGAEILRSGEYAVVNGDGVLAKDGKCKLSYISKNSDIVVGDTVVTSGLGGIYPKGLLIGKITEIKPDIQGISQYAVIKPDADVAEMSAVLIITGE